MQYNQKTLHTRVENLPNFQKCCPLLMKPTKMVEISDTITNTVSYDKII